VIVDRMQLIKCTLLYRELPTLARLRRDYNFQCFAAF